MIRRNLEHWLNWHGVANGRAGEDRGSRLRVVETTLPPQTARDKRGVLVVVASSLIALAWLGLLREVRVGLPSLAPSSPRGTTEASRDLPGDERQGVGGPASKVI